MEDGIPLNRAELGQLSELEFCLRATRLGYQVFVPQAGYSRIDAILVLGRDIRRVQIKTATLRDGILHFKTASQAYNPKTGKCTKDMFYTEDDVDYFGLYCAQLKKCWIVPISYCKNKQRARLVYEASDVKCLGCLPAAPFEF